jgi:subtilase family serine protease
MKPNRSLLTVAASLLVLPMLLAPKAHAQSSLVKPRLSAPVSSASMVTLAGTHPRIVEKADDLGALSGSQQMQGISLSFSLTAAQQSALTALMTAQQTPGSPQYHQWLTPDQFAAQFGVAASDIAATESWLQSQGFTVEGVSRSHTRIFFSGTAAQVQAAFGASLHNFRMLDGTTHYAPAADLKIPAALSGLVQSVDNLSSFRPQAHFVRLQKQFTSSVSGSHFLQPGDISVMYDVKPLYMGGYNGANQSIVVVGQSEVMLSDIAAFQTATGIAGKTPTTTLMPNTGTAAITKGDEGESDLDLEYTSTMAPGAQVNFVYTGNNGSYGAIDAMIYAIDQDLAPIISASYGNCEIAFGASSIKTVDTALQQAATQGQTVIVSAGDNGSTDCYNAGLYSSTDITDEAQLAVDYPASSPYVVAMGGTEIPYTIAGDTSGQYWANTTGTASTAAQALQEDVVTSLLKYPTEQVWNDDSAEGQTASGGGGISALEPRPSWQSGTIGGQAIPTGSYRLVPDISLTASNYSAPLLFCSSDTSTWATGTTTGTPQQASCNSGLRDAATGDLTEAGGTSFDAPIFAGMLAVMNQALGNGAKGVGLITPTLYTLASNSATYGTAFHDITSGGNQCLAGATVCGTGASVSSYAATTGYDEASGLGSIDVNNLYTAWAALGTNSTAVTVLAANASPLINTADTISITVAPLKSTVTPTGTVSISVDGGTATTATLTNGAYSFSYTPTTASSHTITVTYGGDTNYAAGSTGAVTLNAVSSYGTFALAANPATVTVKNGSSTTFNISATPANGYTGTIVLSNISYSPSTLTNFCIADQTNGYLHVTGTTAVSDTVTIYTSSTQCSSLGLQTFGKSGVGGRLVLRRGRVVAANTSAPLSPLRRSMVPAALACLLLSFGFGRRSRERRRLLRGISAVACVALLSLAGFGLTACSNNSSSSTGTGTGTGTTGSTSNTTPGTYTLTFTGSDDLNTSIASATTSVTVTVN